MTDHDKKLTAGDDCVVVTALPQRAIVALFDGRDVGGVEGGKSVGHARGSIASGRHPEPAAPAVKKKPRRAAGAQMTMSRSAYLALTQPLSAFDHSYW